MMGTHKYDAIAALYTYMYICINKGVDYRRGLIPYECRMSIVWRVAQMTIPKFTRKFRHGLDSSHIKQVVCGIVFATGLLSIC